MKQNISNLQGPASEGGTGGGVAGTLSQAKQSVTQAAHETASKIKSTASETAARAKEEAQRMAQQKKDAAANRVGSYSSALHESARSLEEEDPNIAWFTHRAADRLQGVADYVRNRDFVALRQDAESVARRHPAAFFGGMFLAGLVLGSVLTASSRRSEESWSDDGSDATNDPVGEDTAPGATTETGFPGATTAGI